MRVVITSDLHYAEDWYPALGNLAQQIIDEVPDVFLIAGDLGEPLENFEATLDLFGGLSCPKALVVGNHDVWHREGPYTSLQLWEEVLPAVSHEHGYVWLEEENLVLGDIAFCGTMGWYDYSGRDPGLGFSLEDYEELKGLVNLDARYIDWPYSDRELSNQLRLAFADRLEALDRERNTYQQIVVVTHVPAFEECILRRPDDHHWNFSNAYFANLTLGRIIAPRTKVSLVVSGHRHIGGHWRVNFGGHEFDVHIVDSDYGKPDYLVFDL